MLTRYELIGVEGRYVWLDKKKVIAISDETMEGDDSPVCLIVLETGHEFFVQLASGDF